MFKISNGNEENNCLEEANYCFPKDANTMEEFLRIANISRHSSPCSSVVSSSWSLVSTSLISLDEYETSKEQQQQQQQKKKYYFINENNTNSNNKKKSRASSFIKRWIPSSHHSADRNKKTASIKSTSSLSDSFIDVSRTLDLHCDTSPSIQRYTMLFDSINDGNQVDGTTVKTIWAKSNLPKQVLYQIWCQCDPMQRGVLDKNAFITGMKKIDTILEQKNKIKNVT